jgi:hypothetical protein
MTRTKSNMEMMLKAWNPAPPEAFTPTPTTIERNTVNIAEAICQLLHPASNAKTVTPLDDNETMLIYLRNNPDHVVSTADTQYLEHRSY